MYMAGQKHLITEHLLYLQVCELLSSPLKPRGALPRSLAQDDMDTSLSLPVSDTLMHVESMYVCV